MGPGLECVYGAEVTGLACYVNLYLGIFSFAWPLRSYPIPYLCVNLVEQAVCVCVCVVTGSLNSTVQA